jgi:hypothetical protein
VPGSKQQADRYKWVVLSNSPFASGLHTAFDFAIAACLAAAAMSWLRGGKYHYREEAEPVPVQSTKAA